VIPLSTVTAWGGAVSVTGTGDPAHWDAKKMWEKSLHLPHQLPAAGLNITFELGQQLRLFAGAISSVAAAAGSACGGEMIGSAAEQVGHQHGVRAGRRKQT
jgi:hypothetical protein